MDQIDQVLGGHSQQDRGLRIRSGLARLNDLFSHAEPNDPEVQKRRGNAERRRQKLVAAAGGQTRLCMICMTPRSGSTFLAEAMKTTAQLGKPAEWLNARDDRPIARNIARYGCASREEVLEYTYNFAATDNGVFTIKSDYYQALPFFYDGTLEHCFDRVDFVYLTRRDLVAQAISRYISNATSKWSSVQKHQNRDVEVDYSHERITTELNYLLDMEMAWRGYFATRGIQPLHLFYEDLNADVSSSVKQIADYIGVDLTNSVKTDEISNKRVSTSRNMDWAERYRAEIKLETARLIENEGLKRDQIEAMPEGAAEALDTVPSLATRVKSKLKRMLG